jgi:hypothetical protein
MDTKTYKVVGISTSPQGETKIRFAQDLVIQNQNLGDEKTHQYRAERDATTMSKEAAIAWMITQADFNKPEVRNCWQMVSSVETVNQLQKLKSHNLW